ncbi:hypothetical protein ACJ6WD_35530 [Streptomyces sp. VTCC 41912]|uniref:hypothetical protein n=1 Tax=Streptomyces sp. VTCC 41912 TaxID=3383243 RepID=UPI003896C071
MSYDRDVVVGVVDAVVCERAMHEQRDRSHDHISVTHEGVAAFHSWAHRAQLWKAARAVETAQWFSRSIGASFSLVWTGPAPASSTPTPPTAGLRPSVGPGRERQNGGIHNEREGTVAEGTTPKKRRSAKEIQARKEAALLAAQFQVAEAERLDIAAQLVLVHQQIIDAEAETERQLDKLRQRRAKVTEEKRAAAERLVVKMLDTGVSQAEAAQRLGITIDQVRTAKTNVEQRALAAAAVQRSATDADESDATAAENDMATAASATLPQQQSGQLEAAAAGATQPPGSVS